MMVALLAAVAFVACSDSDSPDNPLPVPEQPAKAVHEMGFTCNFAEPTTRGIGDGEYNDEMLRDKGFGVYCWYTGTTHFDPAFTPPKTHIKDYLLPTGNLLMNNQKVEWNSTSAKWGYTPKKYWPINPEELLTLRAYAPYTSYVMTDEHGMPLLPVVLATETRDDVVYGTDYHNGTQHDPLWGTGRLVLDGGEYDPDIEHKKYGDLYDNITYEMSGDYRLKRTTPPADTRNGTIDWYFHHGMSCLMFTCSIVADPGCDKVTIVGFEIGNLYTRGLLSLSSPTASESEKPIWPIDQRAGDMKVKFDGATTTDGGTTWTPGDLAPAPDPNPERPENPDDPYPFVIKTNFSPARETYPFDLLSHGLLIIPRDHSEGEGLQVKIIYKIDTDSEPMPPAVGTIKRNFEGNTKYTLKMKLTPTTGGLEIETVQSAFTQWSDGGSGEHEVYNW